MNSNMVSWTQVLEASLRLPTLLELPKLETTEAFCLMPVWMQGTRHLVFPKDET